MSEKEMQICVLLGAVLGASAYVLFRIIVDLLNDKREKKASNRICNHCSSHIPNIIHTYDSYGREIFFLICPACGYETQKYSTLNKACKEWLKMNRIKLNDTKQ